MSLELDAEYAAIHRRNVQNRSAERRNPNVRWEVQILNDELKKTTGTQSIRPHEQHDIFKYKKMLALYHETIKAFPGTSVWLVGITKDWSSKNIYYHEG